MRTLRLLVPLLVVAGACSAGDPSTTSSDDQAPSSSTVSTGAADATSSTVPLRAGELRNIRGYVFPAAPTTPDGPLDPALASDLDTVFASLATEVDPSLVQSLGDHGDARVGWLVSDIVRFFQRGAVHDAAIVAFERATSADISADPIAVRSTWQSVTDHMFAWELPEPPGYIGYKGSLFTLIEPGWEPFFDAAPTAIDWRFVSWGGVRIDDRQLGDALPCPRGCIPALDDPAVTDAAGGDWYPDDRLVFGLVVNGEARAYPKNIMEVHEMVNDTLGGRRLGIPYCTLCGSAQAYFTDSVPEGIEIPVLRTSGLLTRSNKVMYDLVTKSVFDTFLGNAVSGPLLEQGVVLDQATVITAPWGEWKADHPDTTIVARDGGINRSYELDPLRGRDDDGPIFPIGDVDERLPVQAQVLGVQLADGTAIAFPVDDVKVALAAGDQVELAGVRVVADGGGVRAELLDGTEVAGHQAFWFAWSQFVPATLIWTPFD